MWEGTKKGTEMKLEDRRGRQEMEKVFLFRTRCINPNIIITLVNNDDDRSTYVLRMTECTFKV